MHDGGQGTMPGADRQASRSRHLIVLFVAAFVMAGAGIGNAVIGLSGHQSLIVENIFLGVTILAAAAIVWVAVRVRRGTKN